MADGKWIRDLTPEMPSDEAARLVLRTRLEVVREQLQSTSRLPYQDTEIVHQLRVATRRADAAVRVFRSFLPRKVYRSARKRLRGIRQSAGVARDWDVFLLALEERYSEAKPTDLPGLDCLIGMALDRRLLANEELDAIESANQFNDLIVWILDQIEPSKEDGAKEFNRLAQTIIKQRIDRFNLSTAADLQCYDALHQVRITGKRLRYAMEIFWDCFSQVFRDELYPLIEELQDILGRANDSHVASLRLTAFREQLKLWPGSKKRMKPGIDALIRQHQRRLIQERRNFEKWLIKWRQSPSHELFDH